MSERHPFSGDAAAADTHCDEMERVMLCKECSAELRPGLRFCGGCGAAVAMAPPAPIPPVTRPLSAPDATTASTADRPGGRRGIWAKLTGSMDPLHADPAGDDGADGLAHPEVAYDTVDWDPEDVVAVTAALDARDVAWYMEGGDLVVASRHESLADNVVLSVTGIDPNDDDDAASSPSSEALDDEQFAAAALDYTTDDWSPMAFSEITTALDTAGVRWMTRDGYLLVPEEAEADADRIILSVTGEQPR